MDARFTPGRPSPIDQRMTARECGRNGDLSGVMAGSSALRQKRDLKKQSEAQTVYVNGDRPMEQTEDRHELEREIERAKRLAAGVTDQTTYQRLTAFIEELRQRLKQRLTARRSREKIKARAWELWEQQGRPLGRDVEFWLQAERELQEDE